MTPQTVREEGLEYHRIHRAGRGGGWWSVLGVTTAVGGFLVAQVVTVIGFTVYYGITSDDPADDMRALVDPDRFQPIGLLFLLLAISLAIPFMLVGNLLVSGLKPRWLSSVTGRIRWRWLAVSIGTAFLGLVLAIVLAALLPTTEADPGAGANDFTRTTFEFLLVVVLLVPVQAAAEEFVFRGLLTQSFGSLVSAQRVARVLAVVGPAVLFALFHGSQSWPVFIDRLAFGIVAGVLVIATGGLEAGIAYHVVNNYVAFTLALLFGDIGESLDPEGGNGWDVVVTIVKSGVFLLLSLAAARRSGLQTRTSPGVLEAPSARV